MFRGVTEMVLKIRGDRSRCDPAHAVWAEAMRSEAAPIGTAKPMPSLLEAIAVLMPMTRLQEVDERPTAVARVDGRVGLDEVLEMDCLAGLTSP